VTCTAVENERSINLLKRLGMRIELDVTEPGGVLATLENPKN
jgi:RimJ/RimL family protein N-acetyltransferase